MILGLGTDIVNIERFKNWQKFSEEQLLKIFSEEELSYCKIDNNLEFKYSLESLAVRFAVKEAFFKALSQCLVKLNFTEKTFSFIFTCQNVKVIKKCWDVPEISVNWCAFEEKINKKIPKLDIQLSLSHEKSIALAVVLLSLSIN